MKYFIITISITCSLLTGIAINATSVFENPVFKNVNTTAIDKISPIIMDHAELLINIMQKIKSKDFDGIEESLNTAINESKLNLPDLMDNIVIAINFLEENVTSTNLQNIINKIPEETKTSINAVSEKVITLSTYLDQTKQFLTNKSTELKKNRDLTAQYIHEIRNFLSNITIPTHPITQALDFNSINASLLNIYEHELTPLYNTIKGENITLNTIKTAMENIIKIANKEEFNISTILPLLKLIKNKNITSKYPSLVTQVLQLLVMINNNLKNIQNIEPEATWHTYIPTLPHAIEVNLASLASNSASVEQIINAALENIKGKILGFLQPQPK